MAHLWTVITGHDLGTYQESITQTIPLPVVTGTTLSLISGKLPGGLRIENDSLIGTPFEVKRLRNYTFVLRAEKDNIKEDNFKLIIYVSCNKNSLSRDLNTLSKHYYISSMAIIDMFPQTYHCEVITILKKIVK